MSCTSACPTPGAHQSWGECRRSLGLRTAYMQEWKGLDYTREKKWTRELDAYADAKAQGIQPDSTRIADIEGAVRVSNETGYGYDSQKAARTDVGTLT